MAMKEPSNDEVHSGALSNHMPQLVAFTDSLAAFSANLDDSIREIHDRCHDSDGGESSTEEIICPFVASHISFRLSNGISMATLEICRNKNYVFNQADHFLREQHARLQNIERSLLQRVEDILPVNKDLMTAAELVQICQNLNRMNLDFARHLETRITQGTCDTDASNSSTTTYQQLGISTTTGSTVRDSRFSNNAHLHSVAEADYETDATTTPEFAFVLDQASISPAIELKTTRYAIALHVVRSILKLCSVACEIIKPVLSLIYIFSFTVYPELKLNSR